MKCINELKEILQKYLDWHKSRIDCFVRMIMGIIETRTVALTEVSKVARRTKNAESAYKRVIRFLKYALLGNEAIAELIFNLFEFKDKKFYLVLDRTEWDFGKKRINILLIGIEWVGIVVPIYWKMLEGKGNSKTELRVELIDRFIKRFGKEGILGVIGDREFTGGKWFEELRGRGINFCMRIRENAKVKIRKKAREKHAWAVFAGVRQPELRMVEGAIVYGQRVNLMGTRTSKQQFLILATTAPVEEAREIYVRRWAIETLFGCLKTKGFNLEATHLKSAEKIERLLAVVAIAFCWAFKIGLWKHCHVKRIVIKNHERPLFNFFRYGLDEIRNCLLSTFQSWQKDIKKWIKVLFDPPPLIPFAGEGSGGTI